MSKVDIIGSMKKVLLSAAAALLVVITPPLSHQPLWRRPPVYQPIPRPKLQNTLVAPPQLSKCASTLRVGSLLRCNRHKRTSRQSGGSTRALRPYVMPNMRGAIIFSRLPNKFSGSNISGHETRLQSRRYRAALDYWSTATDAQTG